jgi:hypothetical protein
VAAQYRRGGHELKEYGILPAIPVQQLRFPELESTTVPHMEEWQSEQGDRRGVPPQILSNDSQFAVSEVV